MWQAHGGYLSPRRIRRRIRFDEAITVDVIEQLKSQWFTGYEQATSNTEQLLYRFVTDVLDGTFFTTIDARAS